MLLQDKQPCQSIMDSKDLGSRDLNTRQCRSVFGEGQQVPLLHVMLILETCRGWERASSSERRSWTLAASQLEKKDSRGISSLVQSWSTKRV